VPRRRGAPAARRPRRAGLLAVLALALRAAVAGEPAPEAPPPPDPSVQTTSGLARFHGAAHVLPDGRVEFHYDWSDPAQLGDWRPSPGAEPRIVDGELRLGGLESKALTHAASFHGSLEVAGTWQNHEELHDHGHCGIALCGAPWRGYWLLLRDWRQTLYRMDGEPIALASSEARFRTSARHTFHFARLGNWLRAWVDGALRMRASDSRYHDGLVVVRAWGAHVGLRDLWLMGRPEPQWLARNPDAAKQLRELRVYASGVETLGPTWEKGAYAQAPAEAKALTAQPPYTASPAAAKWLAEDAEALAALWQAVEAGAAKVKAGEAVRAGGAEGAFVKCEGGSIFLRRGEETLARKLASLHDGELLALAQRARTLDPGRDHVALALLRLHGAPPDPARARAALALALKAGLDVSRHRGLLIPRPPTAEARGAVKRSKGEPLAFTGKPLFVEAEAASALVPPMVAAGDPGASGGQFVWEPATAGQGQYGNQAGRAVFHVLVDEERTAHLWARVRAPSNDANSFRVAVVPGETTSGNLVVWHLAARGQWTWQPFNVASGVDLGSTQPSALKLQPGVNSIIIAVRERAAAVDRICLSASPDAPVEPPRQ